MSRDISQLEIRLLEERDLEALGRELGISRDHIDGRWREREAGERTAFVAELDGAMAGFVSLEERKEFPGQLHLFELGVLEPLRGLGIGTWLIEAIEAEARRLGLNGVYLGVGIDNVAAVRLYERLGYERVGEPFDSRWIWYGPDGEEREVRERCYRMVRRFDGG